MALALLVTGGGRVVLPDRALVLVSRPDGGALIVDPPREVWDRTELTPAELIQWSWLVAATAKAMLETLPALAGGCINYWDAGNWALNDAAEPKGPKRGPTHRRCHLHLLGRSPTAPHPDWRWGEAPSFPRYPDRLAWAAGNERLTPEECLATVDRAAAILRDRYRVEPASIHPGIPCLTCGYPSVDDEPPMCPECR